MPQELPEKQKPPTHQRGGYRSSGGDFIQRASSPHIVGNFVPDQGHLSSPLPGCQTRLRVIPDVGWIVSSQRLDATKICVIGNAGRCLAYRFLNLGRNRLKAPVASRKGSRRGFCTTQPSAPG